MARRGSSRRRVVRSSRKQSVRPQASTRNPHPTTRRSSRFASLVSAITTRATSLARKARARRLVNPSARRLSKTASSTSGAQQVTASPSTRQFSPLQAVQPVTRRSTVRKPPRSPTRRTTRAVSPASTPSAGSLRSTSGPHTSPFGVESPSATPGGSVTQPDEHAQAGPATTFAAAGQEDQFSIPNGYGEDRIVLMVKDPWWLFAYWEIQLKTERAARSQLLPHEIAGLQTVLRVYDVTGLPAAPAAAAQSAHRWFDISLSGLATNWYIHTNAPTRSFVVELGILTNGGRFLPLARSNRVTAPRFGPSEVIDEAWVTTDEAYWKLFGASAGIGIGSSPMAWSQLLAQQLFSGNWSSPSPVGPSRQSAVRGFWVRVNTDLVIHGATEPRASVMIQGQPVTVRKDGTFSLRLALPEGTQTVTIDVTSADGRQSRTVTPIVMLASLGTLAPETTKLKAQLHEPGSGTS